MTIQENDAFVREKIGKKCEFKFSFCIIDNGYLKCVDGEMKTIDSRYTVADCPHCHGTGYEPIGLADVLMGLGKQDMFKGMPRTMTTTGCMYEHGKLILAWNLTKSYDEQEESVRLAIGKLIKG